MTSEFWLIARDYPAPAYAVLGTARHAEVSGEILKIVSIARVYILCQGPDLYKPMQGQL